MSTPDPGFAARAAERLITVIPHTHALGVRVVAIGDSEITAAMPVRPEFLGDSERGIVHTGVVTSLIDALSGIAALIRIGHRDTVATLDLRVDYLRPAVPGADLHCRAECHRLTSQIAFVRSSVWQDDEAAPVATSLATFMRGRGTQALTTR